MIVVRRGKEPNSLLQFRKQYPDADYELDMPTNVLQDVRIQMWEEQKHLCAYCMKKIAMHIEEIRSLQLIPLMSCKLER